MTYRQEICYRVGEIIEIVQHIEWHLLEKLAMDGHKEITFGGISGLARGYGIIDHETAIELDYIVAERNDLVHQYFKRQDFEAHPRTDDFWLAELRHLDDLKSRVLNLNHRLSR